MTSIKDIPIEDIENFLYLNDFDVKKDDDIYDLALDIILHEKVEYYPDNIVDWMIAYNNKLRYINTKFYAESEIYKLSEYELLKLSQKLNIDKNSNFRKSLTNVLYYMGRLKKEIFINLEQYWVSGTLIELELQIILDQNNVKMKVSLPENYPETEIVKSHWLRKSGLIYADFNLINPSNSSWDYYLAREVNKIFNIKSKNALILKDFRNMSIEENLSLQDDEIIINKGLGKKILCIGMPYIIDYFKLDPDNTLILLDAQGGAVRKKEDTDKVLQYFTEGRDFMFDLHNKKFSEDYSVMKQFLLKKQNDYLAERLVSLENNENLINYYNKSLGFTQLTYTSKSTLMGTKLSEMIKSCK